MIAGLQLCWRTPDRRCIQVDAFHTFSGRSGDGNTAQPVCVRTHQLIEPTFISEIEERLLLEGAGVGGSVGGGPTKKGRTVCKSTDRELSCFQPFVDLFRHQATSAASTHLPCSVLLCFERQVRSEQYIFKVHVRDCCIVILSAHLCAFASVTSVMVNICAPGEGLLITLHSEACSDASVFLAAS